MNAHLPTVAPLLTPEACVVEDLPDVWTSYSDCEDHWHSPQGQLRASSSPNFIVNAEHLHRVKVRGES